MEAAQPQPNDVVLDGGGHIGGYVRYCSDKMEGAGHIVSVECDPSNLAMLVKNIALIMKESEFGFPRVQVLEGAVGSSSPDTVHQKLNGKSGERSRTGTAQKKRGVKRIPNLSLKYMGPHRRSSEKLAWPKVSISV